MKSRISKLEGDGRTSKRLQESLGKHVKILENALKKEREKVRTLQSGQAPEELKNEALASKDGPKSSIKRKIFAVDDGIELTVGHSGDSQASKLLPGHRA